MDSILSTVLSIFQHNPIFVLAIIGYIAFSFLKGGKSEDSDEYENSGEARTWEEMEREYGISIERNLDELFNPALDHKPFETQQKKFNPEVIQKPVKIQQKDLKEHNKPLVEAVHTVTAPLAERLADFKRDKAMKEGKVLLSDVGVTAKPVEMKKARKSHHAVKEGMKWAFILDKPKALRHRAR